MRRQLSGPIPVELAALLRLQQLYLTDNPQLSGRGALRRRMEGANPQCAVHV
jgi:hypothetical protein